MLLVTSPSLSSVGGISSHLCFQISLNKHEILDGEIGRIKETSHELISDFEMRAPVLMLYSSVHTIIVSARTESTSMAKVLVGPIPDMLIINQI
jgi:hypothetical protein